MYIEFYSSVIPTVSMTRGRFHSVVWRPESPQRCVPSKCKLQVSEDRESSTLKARLVHQPRDNYQDLVSDICCKRA
jgi:hypothetical protein